MRLLRLIVVLATLASLPGYGLAASGHAGGCPGRAIGGAPMASHAVDMAGMDMTGAEGMAIPHDCCPGTAESGSNSDPHEGCPACLAGHGCKNSPGGQPPALSLRRLPPLHQAVAEEPAPHVSQCGPDDLLRPPR